MTPGRYRTILCDSDRINSINLGSLPVNSANSAADVEGFIYPLKDLNLRKKEAIDYLLGQQIKLSKD